MRMKLSEWILQFRSSEKTRIAIYRANQTEKDELYEDLKRQLDNRGCVEIVDYYFLCSYKAMQKDVIDIFVIVESELLSDGECRRIKDYIRGGGALILGGSNMLMIPAVNKKVLADASPFGAGLERIAGLQFYRKTMAHLGVRPYVSDVKPQKIRIDSDFVHRADNGFIPMELTGDSAKCSTTSDLRDPDPYLGTVFAERYEVLRNYEVITGYDAFGRKVTTSVNFAQDYENGARICLFPSNEKGSFLDSNNPYYSRVLEAAVRFCENRVMVSFLEPEYACYRQGEEPSGVYKIKSFDGSDRDVTVKLTISDGNRMVHEERAIYKIRAGEEVKGRFLWKNTEFATDFYSVQVCVCEGERVISKADNAFVIWDEKVVAGGRTLSCGEEYFINNGKKSALFGTNYYESNTNSAMWIHPNIAKLREDFQQMSEFGIEYIRIHYHPPKWFYDFWKYKYNQSDNRFNELKNLVLPTEKYFRIFDAHIYLCQKYRIIYGGDLLTLRPEEMGDPRGWFGVNDYCEDEACLEKQKEFLKLVVARYKDIPGISWDIFNEPGIGGLRADISSELLNDFCKSSAEWAGQIKEYMIQVGETHPITVGDGMASTEKRKTTYVGVADYLSPHGFSWESADLREKSFKGPQFYQEAWLDAMFAPEDERTQMKTMRSTLINTMRTGLAGFSPWQWTGQLAMWQDEGTYVGENWDDMLGCCVRNNATIKPSGRFYRDFITLLEGIELKHYLGNNQVETVDGLLCFKAVEEVKIGDYYMLYEKFGKAYKGIVKGKCEGDGYFLCSDAEDCNLFFDFSGDGKVLFKADNVCRLKVGFDRAIRRAYFLNGNEKLEIPIHNGKIDCVIEDWQTYYWIQTEF